jgi:hypothetical protein
MRGWRQTVLIVKIEKDSKKSKIEHSEIVETLNFLKDNPSSYRNKKLLIVDSESDYNPAYEQIRQSAGIISELIQDIFLQIALMDSLLIGQSL